ncbi:MAG: hypothetical protein ACREUI_06125 [Burkholderiales bacterium]
MAMFREGSMVLPGLEIAGRLGDAKASGKKIPALTIVEHCGNLNLRCPVRDIDLFHASLTALMCCLFQL